MVVQIDSTTKKARFSGVLGADRKMESRLTSRFLVQVTRSLVVTLSKKRMQKGLVLRRKMMNSILHMLNLRHLIQGNSLKLGEKGELEVRIWTSSGNIMNKDSQVTELSRTLIFKIQVKEAPS